MSYYSTLEPTPEFNKFWLESQRLTNFAVAVIPAIFTATSSSGKRLPQKQIDGLYRLNDESMFCRIVDNFQCYIIELLISIFKKNPKMLSGTKIDGATAFEVGDIKDIQQIVIEKMATTFSYMNVVDLDVELKKRFSFELFPKRVTKLRVKRVIEIRNLIVHNRGLINRRFLEKVGSKFDQIGSSVSLGAVIHIDDYFMAVAEQIDQNAREKFSLESGSYAD